MTALPILCHYPCTALSRLGGGSRNRTASAVFTTPVLLPHRQRRTASQLPNDCRIRPLFESVKPLEFLSNPSHTTLEQLSHWHFHWHRRDWLSNALVGAFLEPTTPVFTVRGQLIAESSWVEQGNHIHRCNKLARNHPAFASFEFLDSTASVK